MCVRGKGVTKCQQFLVHVNAMLSQFIAGSLHNLVISTTLDLLFLSTCSYFPLG